MANNQNFVVKAGIEVNTSVSIQGGGGMFGYALATQTGSINGQTSAYYGLTIGQYTGMTGGGVGLNGYYGVMLGTGGQERVRVDSAGSVLIGTSTAYRGGKLVISAASVPLSSTTANFNLYTSDSQGVGVGASMTLGGMVDTAATNNVPFVYLAGRKENSTNGDFAGYLQVGVTQGNANTIEAMRVSSLGNVGIGSTAPATRLDVRLPDTFSSVVSDSTLNNSTLTALRLSMTTDPSAAITANTGVALALSATPGRGEVFIAGVHPTTSKDQGDLTMWTTSGGVAYERVRVDSLGTVNVNGPASTAHINLIRANETGAFSWLRFARTDGTRCLELIANSTTAAYGIPASAVGINAQGLTGLHFSTADTLRMSIDGSGKVGIGTATPQRSLDVNGSLRIADGGVLEYGGPSANISGSSLYNYLTFNAGSTEKMRVDSGGLCVGTTGFYSSNASGETIYYIGLGSQYGLTLNTPDTSATNSRILNFLAGGNNTGGGSPVLRGYLAQSSNGIQLTGSNGLTLDSGAVTTFWNNGAERMRIDTSGNLLVGVTSSIRKAVFGGKAVLDVVLKSTAASGSAGNSTLYFGNAATDAVGYVNYDHSGNYINIAVNAVERLRVTDTGISVTGTVTESSTIRIKENIRPMTGALASVLALRGVIYDLKDQSASDQPGLIAEEVFEVLPKLVAHDGGEITGVNYARLSAVLVEAMKEQEARIKKLEAMIAKLVD